MIPKSRSGGSTARGAVAPWWGIVGAPHRSLSAAHKNLSRDAQADLTERYMQLCAHYGMTATRNNRGVSHENGAVESPHGHIKRRIAQASLLRDSANFPSLQDYRDLIGMLSGGPAGDGATDLLSRHSTSSLRREAPFLSGGNALSARCGRRRTGAANAVLRPQARAQRRPGGDEAASVGLTSLRRLPASGTFL